MLGENGQFGHYGKVIEKRGLEKEQKTREEIAEEQRKLLDAILFDSIGALEKAKGKSVQEGQKEIHQFEAYLDQNELGGYKYRELFEIRLREILDRRNKLFKLGARLSKSQPDKLGYPADEWGQLGQSYSVEYEKNPYFGKWPFLVRAEKLLGQRERLVNILSKCQENNKQKTENRKQ